MATDGGQPWRDRSCYLALYSCHLQTKPLKALTRLTQNTQYPRKGHPFGSFAHRLWKGAEMVIRRILSRPIALIAIARLAGGEETQCNPSLRNAKCCCNIIKEIANNWLPWWNTIFVRCSQIEFQPVEVVSWYLRFTPSHAFIECTPLQGVPP